MKYILLFVDDREWDQAPPAEVQDMYAKVGEWWGKHSQSGAITGGEQLQPRRTATTVHCATGKVTDGPFLETKESIGGFAIVDVADLDTAIAMAKTWPASAKVEIRPLVTEDDGDGHEH